MPDEEYAVAYLFVLGSVVCAVVGQLLYKRYRSNRQWPWLLGGLGFFSLAVPCTMLAARDLGIGMVYVGSSLSYILAPVCGRWMFAEPIQPTHWKYFVLIMLGVVIYAW